VTTSDATTIDPAWLETLTLAKGGHNSPDEGLCLLEAVAYVRGVEHTDRPRCVSEVLGTYGRALNDCLPHEPRQQLKPFIVLLPGTAHDGLDEQRSYLALDWLIRTWTPAWLDVAGLSQEATALRGLRRIVDLVTAEEARPVVLAARDNAAAAWAAARAAAGAAAWAATGAAARAAARAATGAAAWDATWAAARAAARAAAWDAARDATWAAAWDAARAAAGAVLRPTVESLQALAIDLFALRIRPVAQS